MGIIATHLRDNAELCIMETIYEYWLKDLCEGCHRQGSCPSAIEPGEYPCSRWDWEQEIHSAVHSLVCGLNGDKE